MYESAGLSPRFLQELKLVIEGVRTHAHEFWNYNSEETRQIKPNKIDVAMDLYGGFVAQSFNQAYETLGELMRKCVSQVFAVEESNFLTLGKLTNLKTESGVNNLDSCFQYQVTDETGEKLLNIKAYDKVLDLVGREATKLVSTRLSTILGSTQQKGVLTRQIRKHQYAGMTRLEISVCRSAIERFSPWEPSVKTIWHKKVALAMDKIVADVLNDKRALALTYRRMSLPRLINRLCTAGENILAIGRRHSWIINAKTSHKYHFVGSRATALLTKDLSETRELDRLRNLALRHASPGSTIDVYWLHQEGEELERSAVLSKVTGSLVQAPGCNKEGLSGIHLSDSICNPIPVSKLSPTWLQGWDEAVRCIVEAGRKEDART